MIEVLTDQADCVCLLTGFIYYKELYAKTIRRIRAVIGLHSWAWCGFSFLHHVVSVSTSHYVLLRISFFPPSVYTCLFPVVA